MRLRISYDPSDIMIKLNHSQSDPQGKIVARIQNLVTCSLQGSAIYVLSIHYDRTVLSIRYDRTLLSIHYDRLNGSIRIGLSCAVGCASRVALYLQCESFLEVGRKTVYFLAKDLFFD